MPDTALTPAELTARLRDLEARLGKLEPLVPQDRLTLGIIKGDLDYLIAALIIALGATAYDMEVDLFFTFWATAALRDPKKKAKKGFLDAMFGMMLPRGTRKLPLSKMQMAGLGPQMIRMVMGMKHVKSVEELLAEAARAGIRIHVCTMSMDVMGIKKEELIDYPHLDYVGVGSFVDMFSKSKQCWFM